MVGRTRNENGIRASQVRLLLEVLLCSLFVSEYYAFSFPRTIRQEIITYTSTTLKNSAFGTEDDPVVSAIRSLADYHEGEWKGRARSFTVTLDTAAGIVQRELSPEYTATVKLSTSRKRIEESADMSAPDTISLSETVHWGNKISHRSIPLFTPPSGLSSQDHYQQECGVGDVGDVDVDEVDASYSLDITEPTEFPSVLSGISGKSGIDTKPKFVVEHCIAAGEDRRCRCFAVYGEGDSLLRVVVSDEKRTKKKKNDADVDVDRNNGNNVFTINDMIEMENDIDRLVNKISGNIDDGSNSIKDDDSNDETDDLSIVSTPKAPAGSDGSAMIPADSTIEGTQDLSPHPISLLDISNGLWLGDMIIRETPNVSASPTVIRQGKGFGQQSTSTPPSPTTNPTKCFAEWNTGVQKIVWRWIWNFEEDIRLVVDAGKSLGIPMDDVLKRSLAGTVCVDESFSRRKPKDERMVYIDWGQDSIGFLLGPFTVRVPRYVHFDPSAPSPRAAAVSNPIYTEFGIFQTGGSLPGSSDDDRSEEICCSKISRLYNFQGRLKQGCTSFYIYKPFDVDDDDNDDADI